MMHTPARTHEMSLERARLAARHAAQAHLDALDEAEKSNAPGNGLAVLTWGAMAMACSLAAAVTIALPLVDSDWLVGNKLAQTETSSLERTEFSKPADQAINKPSVSDDLLAPAEPTLEELAATTPPPTPPATEGASIQSDEPLDQTVVAAIRPSETVFRRDELSNQAPQNPLITQDSLTVSIPLPKSAVSMDMQLAALKRRAPGLFQAKAVEANENGSALNVGPFTSPAEIARFCRNIKLSLTLDCKAG